MGRKGKNSNPEAPDAARRLVEAEGITKRISETVGPGTRKEVNFLKKRRKGRRRSSRSDHDRHRRRTGGGRIGEAEEKTKPGCLEKGGGTRRCSTLRAFPTRRRRGRETREGRQNER